MQDAQRLWPEGEKVTHGGFTRALLQKQGGGVSTGIVLEEKNQLAAGQGGPT